MEDALDLAQKQLDRCDKPLTKADLVAIIIALEPKHAANAETLSSTMTIPDCNAMIRSMTYDVKRYVGVEGIEGNHQARLESTSTALVPR